MRSPKDFLVMFRKVKGTFPKKVDPPPQKKKKKKRTFLGGGGEELKSGLEQICFKQDKELRKFQDQAYVCALQNFDLN